jgi:hypothetical protein
MNAQAFQKAVELLGKSCFTTAFTGADRPKVVKSPDINKDL